MAVAVIATAACALVAATLAFHAGYYQWAEGDAWRPLINFHGPDVLLLIGTVISSALLLLLAAALLLRNWRKPKLRNIFAGWTVLLATVVGSFFVPNLDYVAAAVAVLGPGRHSIELQREAARADSLLLLNSLVLRGAQLEDGLLVSASHVDSPDVVKRLVSLGMPINGRFFGGKVTALHNAVEGRQYGVAEILLRAGARPDIPNAAGVTPLDMAASQKDERMLALLRAARPE